MRNMTFGLSFVGIGPMSEPAMAADVAIAAEELGFTSLWMPDHVVVPEVVESRYPYSADGKMPGGAGATPSPDPLVWLAFVAARTRTIRLCTGVLVLAQRNPLVVAKQAATLDVLSGGRLTLGVGVGWLAEEFGALGERFSDRGERLDEYLAVMRAMWGEQPARFAGRFFDVPEVHCVPRPMQSDGVPLVVGGDSVHAARRAGRSGDGWFPGFPSPEALAPLVDTMMAAAEANGRDGRTIALSTSYTTDEAALERLRTLGFDHFTVAVPAHKIVGPGALDAALEALAKRIGLR